MNFPLALQDYQAKSIRENPQTLINMYAVQDKGSGKFPVALYPCPGLPIYVDTTGSSVRGLHSVNDIVYVVKDNKFGKITASTSTTGTYAEIGTITTSSGRVRMASTFDQVLIATGSTGYVYTISTDSFDTIVSANFPAFCSWVTAQDGYFIAVKPDSDQYFISNLSDGLTWSALDFASVESKSGDLLAAISIFQQVWFLKSVNTEIWWNAGGSFPFSRQDGTSINFGTVSAHSVVVMNNLAIWLGQSSIGSGYIISSSGNEPEIISNEALNYHLRSYTLTDAFAYSYQYEGNEFYVITFPTDNKTWQYNLNTGLWNELNSINTTAISRPAYTRHRANCYAALNGTHLVGDFISGKVFRLDNTVYFDDTSNIIQRKFVTPNFSRNGKILSIYSLELFVDVGQGLVTGQGSDPMIMMEVSKDGGYTWGNEKWRSLGKLGKYKTRVKWNALGHARDWSFRFTVTDPVKVVILGAEVSVDAEEMGPIDG